jgi:hypothetical protein
MKTANLLLLCSICVATSIAGHAQMLITGVIDGPLSGGTPKAVELYALEDIADLSIYGLGCANNGGGSDGQEFTFPVITATKGQYIYIASDSTGFNDFLGVYPDYKSNAANINGDDAIELFRNGVVIDVFGDINTDGTGQQWEYLDGWAYRNNGTNADGDSFSIDNWTFSGINALDGEMTNAAAATPFPIGTYEPSVAVRLATFYAVIHEDRTVVSWETSMESNCAGFYVLSSTTLAGPYKRENNILIMAEGGCGTSRLYTFEIMPPQPEHVFFQLEEITLDGASYYYPPVQASFISSIKELALPVSTLLLDNYPNPFNSTTIISFSLKNESAAIVQILDLRGRVIRSLSSGTFSAGRHLVRWKGFDDQGQETRSGVYFYRLRAGDFTITKKMTLLR